MATSPAKESDIKYAVMTAFLCMNQICGMIAVDAIISGANRIFCGGPRANVA
jgi:hypothetical protein